MNLNILKISVFGESHGKKIGAVIENFPSGVQVDMEFICSELARRAPGGDFSTARKESDIPEIVSGILNDKTTGAPICVMFSNSDTHSSDYSSLEYMPRPSHADYTGKIRYNSENDVRGGGHFSGRLTAPIVFIGALCKLYLNKYNVKIASHIYNIGSEYDARLDYADTSLLKVSDKMFPLIDCGAKGRMASVIEQARAAGDSVGGSVECGIYNLPAGLGSPMLGGVENILSALSFMIPAVKAVEFGSGCEISEMMGSMANDEFEYVNGKVVTKTNHNGGILGGITNGMPVIYRLSFKPTPSISVQQNTVNLNTKQNETLVIKGRHDPCVVVRAVSVCEAVGAICATELMLEANGYDRA